jgi:hypothetical protein
MATYSNRTCSECGIRKSQPEMKQTEVYVKTGKSKTGISGATIFGIFFGNKKSGRSFLSWLFNSSQRSYTRKKTVWLCKPCSRKAGTGGHIKKFIKLLTLVIIISVSISFII